MKNSAKEYKEEFDMIVDDIINNEEVKKMHLYRQHCDTSCFQHCKNVAYYSYRICKKLDLDYVSTARGAMLHDFFLYDWRKRHENKLHAFTHPKVAFDNSSKQFDLNDKEKEVILKHMWPVTVKMPKYKECYVVSTMDKICAIQETIDYYRKILFRKKIFRYAYMFLTVIIFSI